MCVVSCVRIRGTSVSWRDAPGWYGRNINAKITNGVKWDTILGSSPEMLYERKSNMADVKCVSKQVNGIENRL